MAWEGWLAGWLAGWLGTPPKGVTIYYILYPKRATERPISRKSGVFWNFFASFSRHAYKQRPAAGPTLCMYTPTTHIHVMVVGPTRRGAYV